MKDFTTQILSTPYVKADAHRALSEPIYSNAAFDFETAEQMELAFQGKIGEHSYSRVSNPTVEHFEMRIRAITGAPNVTAVGSGMAAIADTLLLLSYAGSNIVASRHLFGNTFSFLETTIKAFGVETRFCDTTNLQEVEAKIDDNTVAIFLETVTNPQLEIADLSALSVIARKHKTPLIVDSTLTPPTVFRARQFGVDIELISSTKCISGGATSIGGLIVDYGAFNWTHSPKLSALGRKFGPMAFQYKLRREVFRNMGACMSPFSAYLQSLGLETLHLRFERAVSNCHRISAFLDTHPAVKAVSYPGMKSSPFHELGLRQFGDAPGAILTFELASREACFAMLNRLQLIRRATNIYDNRSLIIHPASTIFCDFDPEKRAALHISDTLLRLSPGIESPDALIADLEQALEE
ncbi:MAG: aminotransferase class I/II-fold pyridoxal phosphate-dependent enzyme [Bacteroidales bacterium]|jgi:O-acetylhomoserine (thiol)-lyase|nr:aminotransferase class I/II-fold pyridoxal phosphate-dependent enzyme [Bacteroidales bacterium]